MKWSHLQVGDTVMVDSHTVYNRYSEETVTAISKAGNISLSNGLLFRPDGTRYGTKGVHANIITDTPEVRYQMELDKLLGTFKREYAPMISHMNVEQLKAAIELFQSFKEEQ